MLSSPQQEDQIARRRVLHSAATVRPAEMALCGAVIDRAALLDELDVDGEHFGNADLRRLWLAMVELHSAGVPLDEITVPEHAGAPISPALMSECVLSMPSARNAEHYASIVREQARVRELATRVSLELTRYDQGMLEPSELDASLQRALDRSRAATAPATPGPALRRVPEIRARLRDMPTGTRVPLGLERLDAALGGGVVPGMFTIVAGGTGAGKSAFVMEAAARRAETGAPVLVATYELDDRELLARVAAQRLGRSWLDVADGSVPAEDVERVTDLPGLAIGESPSLDTLRAWILGMAEQEGETPLVVLDYLQLLVEQFPGSHPHDVRLATQEAVEALRKIARETGAPMLIVSCVSRGGNVRMQAARDVHPQELVDVAKETGSIELSSSGVIVLSTTGEEDEQGRRIATVTVAKSRYGRPCHLDYRFAGASGQWHEMGDAVNVRHEAKRDQIRDQIRASLTAAGEPLAKSAIIERHGEKHVRGRRADIWAALDAMTADGELVMHHGAYGLVNPQ